MSYDIHDGPMDEPLHESEDNINQWVLNKVNLAKKFNNIKNLDKDTITFINKIALSIQEEKEESKQIEEKTEEIEKPEIPSYYIAASIKDDMKKEENER